MGIERRFRCEQGTSRKFWHVKVEGGDLTVHFGRIGTSGQTKSKKLPSEITARREAEALIAEKLRKGYVEEASTAPAPVEVVTEEPREAQVKAPSTPPSVGLPQAARYVTRARWSVLFKRSQVQSLAFSADGKTVVAAGFRAVGRYDAKDGSVQAQFELKEPVGDSWSAAISRDGWRLLLGISGGPGHVVDLASRKVLCKLQGIQNSVGLLAEFTEDGQRVVGLQEAFKLRKAKIVDQKFLLRVWNANTGKEESRSSFAGSHGGLRHTIHGLCVVQMARGLIRFLEVPSGREVARVRDRASAGVHVSPDLVWVLARGSGGSGGTRESGPPTVRVWDLRTARKVLSLKPQGMQPAVAFRSCGRWWTGANGVTLPDVGVLDLGRSRVKAFSPDGRFVALTHTKASRDSVRLLEIRPAGGGR